MYRAASCVAAALLLGSALGWADDRSTCTKGTGGRAIAACSRLIARNPGNDAVAYHHRGFAWLVNGDYDRAISDLDRVIRLKPENAVAYDHRGIAYKEKGDYDRAISDFDQVIRLKPEYHFAYSNRGDAHGAKGDYDRAISDYDRAIQIDPGNSVVYIKRGHAYGAKGDYDRAISDYDQAIRIDPNDATAYGARASAYHQKRDPRAWGDEEHMMKLYTSDPDFREGHEPAPAPSPRGLAGDAAAYRIRWLIQLRHFSPITVPRLAGRP